ncbi:FUSC family protein [Streptomyces sporangiiformans]|uniref:FUSC family protein n=2 Tax=Streptomyces sporangiiformans TaxID=2315329 RepID=A0A505D8W0_9ACTN|nr:aromatic acid exporter family protein [Streptomyces sporangiiformans]TPQ18165.1 FUSC family protein [Streptomyces sporangiiformans]
MRDEARAVVGAARRAGSGPGRERDLVAQSLKAAAAALLAWMVAREWLGDPMALMAPWVAVVLVQATVYSSLRRAAQQFAAICVGTLLASVAQVVTGDTLVALALSVPVLMLLSNWPRLGDQGIYATTVALFTLTTGAVSGSAIGHRLAQAALGAVIGVAVNALVLPPIHLRDVRENLAALAHEAGDVLTGIAEDLRQGDWDASTAANWSHASTRLARRLDGLRAARGWSEESLRLTRGWLRAFHRVPLDVPAGGEDERWSRITGHVAALTRALTAAVDDNRIAGPPDGTTGESYARLLALLGEACRRESRSLLESCGRTARQESHSHDPRRRAEAAMRELHRTLQTSLRDHAGLSAARTAVLGTLLLQAENIWAEIERPGEDGNLDSAVRVRRS